MLILQQTQSKMILQEGKISQLTEIEEIIDFRHPNAAKMKSAVSGSIISTIRMKNYSLQ